MKIDRRSLLGLFGAGAATPAAAIDPVQVYDGPSALLHGVASGDPTTDGVLLWTRVTPSTATDAPVAVVWKVAADPQFKTVVKEGYQSTDASRDHTVKIEVSGLKPGTEYWYSFQPAYGNRTTGEAVEGATKTLPKGRTKDVVLAVASCSLYPGGFFNAYEAIARLPRVDAVLHLGDYIYEYGAAPGDYGMAIGGKIGRAPQPPHEIVTLDDYRARHAQAKADPQLQAAHARAPWIVVWDDHETANDSWVGGAENHDPDKGEGDWAARKAAALKAYYEWMPIREPKPGVDLAHAVQRSFQFGDVASLIMVETRLTGRTPALDYETDLPIKDGKPDLAAFAAKWTDPARRLLSAAQEAWLGRELKASVAAGTVWQVLGNQVVMGRIAAPDLKSQMTDAAWAELMAGLPDYAKRRVARAASMSAFDIPYNLDSWDGYPADRERVYDAFKAAKAHPIVLAGDSHAFWVNELADKAGRRVAAEFGTTGISSPGFGDIMPSAPLGEAFAARNKEVLFNDSAAKGFVLLTLTRQEAKAELVAVSTILAKDYAVKTLKTFTVKPAMGGGVGPVTAI